jgi:ADP-ribose pyrophosphatase YjhB (NUDIX family)
MKKETQIVKLDVIDFFKKDFHIGVYGILRKKEKTLVVRKKRGPYTGLFDLPGGGLSYGESIFNGLAREIKEETGVESKEYSFFGNFSFLTHYTDSKKIKRKLYHVALVYSVNKANFAKINPFISAEDVSENIWIDLTKIEEKECSPILKEIKKNISHKQTITAKSSSLIKQI